MGHRIVSVEASKGELMKQAILKLKKPFSSLL